MKFMILPNKYLPYNKSILFISDRIIKIIFLFYFKNDVFLSFRIEQLWNKIKKEFNKKIKFKDFYLAILFLIAINFFKTKIEEGVDIIEINNN